jgi:FkbM family methyltransferase
MVTARCYGLRIQFPSTNLIAEAFYADAYGRIERAILDKLIAPGDTIVDVGANIGFYTCLFAKRVGPTGRVIAVEPTPSCLELLRHNLRINGLQERVECHPCALSDQEGSAQLYIYPEGEEGFNSLGATQAITGRCSVGTLDISTSTLDKLLSGRRLEKGCFIKIDVEGFEHQVLKGGVEHLRTLRHVALMVELYEPGARQCGSSIWDSVALLEDCGFRAYQTTAEYGLAPLDKEFDRQPLRWGFFPDVFFFKETPGFF